MQDRGARRLERRRRVVHRGHHGGRCRRQVVERLGELGLFGRQPLIEVPRRDRGADERQRDQTGEHDADDSEHEHGRAGTALVHSEQRHRRMVARAKPLTPFRSAWYYVRRYINGRYIVACYREGHWT